MTAVLLHASGIHTPQGKQNWERTIERPVDFRSGPVAAALTPAEEQVLEQLHADGRACFWGTHSYYSRHVAKLTSGDVVVFTGTKRVLGFGRLGLLTDNAALGDAMWPKHPVHGSYRHVYSLAPLAHAEMGQVEFRLRGGFGVADDFRGLRVLTDADAEAFLAAFEAEIPPAPSAPAASPIERELQEVQAYEDADSDVARDLSWVRELSLEIRSVGDAGVRGRSASTMHRGENLLVHDYVQTLPSGARPCRYDTPAGVTDLDVHLGGVHELVEAKSSAARTHIRQALAQLLDYAPSLGANVPNVLTVLVPSRPADSAVALLHRYGIDCVYRMRDGSYERLAAPAGPAAAIAGLWSMGTEA